MLQLQDTSATGPASGRSVHRLLQQLADSPTFAYISILLLQLKVIWGIWNVKDLTPGDTAHYFTSAWDWYKNLQGSFAWSPIYTAFYGLFLHISPDAYFATIGHRVVILLVLAVLVLAVMRRFVSPGIAWLMTAWWVVLPIDFDSKYEIHLFSVIPLVAAILLARLESRWAGPASLAVLLATSILVRNEYIIATALFAAYLLYTEYRRLRSDSIFEKRKTGARYFVCLFAVGVATLFFFVRRTDEDLSRAIADKHELNMCQVYAYGYQQRHNDFTGSPWFDCAQLTTRVFGSTRPGLVEAFQRSPAAMIEHVAWNASLIPAGLQLLLFNTIAAGPTPAYDDVLVRPTATLTLSAALLLTLGFGAWLFYRDRQLRAHLLRTQQLTWALIGSIAIVAVFVMLTQRPRQSYLLAFGVCIRIAAGLAIAAVSSRWPIHSKAPLAIPIAAIAFIAFVPPSYAPDAKGRPLLDAYRKLDAFQPQFQRAQTQFVSQLWSKDLCNYVAKSTTVCTPVRLSELRNAAASAGSLTDALQERRASLFYVDEDVIGDPALKDFFALSRSAGWVRIGAGQQFQREWALYSRIASPIAAQRDIVPPGSGISLGANWYAFERFAGSAFRWVSNDAEFKLDAPVPSLSVDLEPGPASSGTAEITVIETSGRILAHAVLKKRQTIVVDSAGIAAGSVLRLHSGTPGIRVGPDPRILSFRVFRISTDETVPPAAQVPKAAPSADIVDPSDGLQLGRNWYPFEAFGGQQFRWINNDAELFLPAGAVPASLALELQPGPGAAGKTVRLRFVNDAGETKAAADVARLDTIQIRLPVLRGAPLKYTIHIDGGGASIPSDPRVLNVRVFRIRREH